MKAIRRSCSSANDWPTLFHLLFSCLCLLLVVGGTVWLAAAPVETPGEDGQETLVYKTDEDLIKREEWFFFQRTYPFDSLPSDARRRAWEARPSEPLLAEQNWSAIGPTPTLSFFPNNWGVTSGRINAIAVSPADPQRLLVGGATGGLWLSTDGGTNFVPVADDQVDLEVGSIAFSKSDPTIVYAGMGDYKPSGYLGSGVLKSTDAGQTWTRVSNTTLPAPGTIPKIEVDPNDPDRVYVAQFSRLSDDGRLFSSGFYRSTDGGTNWTRTLIGLPRDLVVHTTNPQTLYLAMARVDQAGNPPAGLYRSVNGGSTWTRIFTVPYSSTRDIKVAVTPDNPQTIYVYTGGFIGSTFDVRVVVSTNGGATWINRGAPGLDRAQFGYNTYIFADPANASTVYVGTRDVFKSTNGGVSWTNMTRNFDQFGRYTPRNSKTHPDQHALAFSPEDSSEIYVGNDGGLSKSTDGGQTFTSLNATLSLTQFTSLALHPDDPMISYGGTQDNGTQRRLQDPKRWQEFSTGDGGQCVIDPVDPSTVFTTYVYGTINRYRDDGRRFDRQVGRNSTFGEPNSNPRIAFYPPFTGNGADETLYFGTWRLFISFDLGDSWSAPAETLDLTRGGRDVLSAIGVGPTDPNVIYTGSARGRVMVSTNGGIDWTDITSGLPNRFIKSITVDPDDPAVAYVTVSGFRSGHVFTTTDTGQTWTDISGNLPDIPTNALLIDPIDSNTLYAGTDIGVFRSTVGGTTWETFNSGLPPVIVNAFSAQASGLIQIGTYGRGAYELSTSGSAP